MSESAKPVPSGGRGALVQISRFVLTAVVLLALTALVVAAWANWRREHRFSLRVFDPAWWGVGRTEAQPYIDGARTTAGKAYESVWGDGGLVDQAEAWIKERKTSEAPPATPTQGANVHEAAFAQAEARFEDGVVASRRAKPTPDKALDRAAVREAIVAFTACRDLLDEHLPAYIKLPDHRPAERSKAEDLQRINARLLTQAQKLSEVR